MVLPPLAPCLERTSRCQAHVVGQGPWLLSALSRGSVEPGACCGPIMAGRCALQRKDKACGQVECRIVSEREQKMRTRLIKIGVVGLLLVLGACGASAEVMRWQVDGETREAIVYVPAASRGGEPLPLVLSFHGYGDNMQNFQHTNVHVAWSDAITVYFQGLETRAGLRGWQVARGGVDRDLQLVDVALASLRETYNVDDDRIYATGFSNGGMFAYLLWAERPGVFAAYAPVAASLRPSVRPEQPRPLFHVAGEGDRVVSFSDQTAAIEVATEVNGVADATTRCGEGCTVYGSGTPAPVMTWIHAGAHIYPRGTTERIVAFFREHSRRQ